MTGPSYRDREFDTNTPFTQMKAYVNNTRPEYVRSHARAVLSGLDPGFARYDYAAALTEHVHETVDYAANDNLWRGDYILDHTQQGDCEDVATLLGSLAQCRSFDIRYVVIDRDRDVAGHVMLELLFDTTDIEALTEQARAFYGDAPARLAWEPGPENSVWVPCDPVGSAVVGTTGSSDYRTASDGTLEWNEWVTTDYLRPMS
jgi:hypothetical protein